jgi:uncharacterized protein (TIGR03083 family)
MDQPDHIQLALRESTRLKGYINALPPARWEHPTACELWNVRDLVAHLILGTRYQMTMIARGLAGDCSPPDGFPEAGSVNAETFSPIVHQNTLLVRDSVGDAVLAEYNAVSDAFDAMLRDLDSSSLDIPCYDLRGVATVADFVDLRIMELVIHGWDLRSRLEREAHLPAESYPALARVIRRSFQWLHWPGSTQAPVHYRFDVADLQPRPWDVFIEGSRARLASGSDCPADVTIGCDGESFILLMFGRLSAHDARADGRMTISGDETQADMLDQWFRGF